MDKLKEARKILATLTPAELVKIRSEAADLLAQYAQGGVLSGRGSLEVKHIRGNRDEDGNFKYHDYLYVRRARVDANGKVTTVTTGYYGKAGILALEAGYGDALLDAHERGGEAEGDALLSQLGYIPPKRTLPNKPPAHRPTHPLHKEEISTDYLQHSILFQYFQKHAPLEASILFQQIADFESDLRSFNDANQYRLRYRLRNEYIERRRRNSRRKHERRRVPRR